MAVVRSLREIASAVRKNVKIEHIVLKGSEDLICNNMMCEKVTEPCVCRLERVLETVTAPGEVRSIDISGNRLPALPPSLEKFTPHLERLDLSHNALTELPAFVLDMMEGGGRVETTGNPVR